MGIEVRRQSGRYTMDADVMADVARQFLLSQLRKAQHARDGAACMVCHEQDERRSDRVFQPAKCQIMGMRQKRADRTGSSFTNSWRAGSWHPSLGRSLFTPTGRNPCPGSLRATYGKTVPSISRL